MRESPALKIIKLLEDRAPTVYHDPFVDDAARARPASRAARRRRSTAPTCALIVTAHPERRPRRVVEHAPLASTCAG